MGMIRDEVMIVLLLLIISSGTREGQETEDDFY